MSAQCRAARALLDWSQQELASAAGVGVVTVRQFEAGVGVPRNSTMETLMNTLEAAGIEFITGNGAGPGVRFRDINISHKDFIAFVRQYERSSLRSLGRQVGYRQYFDYLFYYKKDGSVDLTCQGQKIGNVRYNNSCVEFYPPLLGDCEPSLTDEAFTRWIESAENKKSTTA